LASLTDAQWNEYTKDNTRFDVGWPDYRDERSLTPESIRNIYTDLSNALFGRRYPATAGYLLDPGYRSGIGIWHSGFDLSAPQRTPVKAVVGGTIVRGIQDINGNYFIGVRGDDGKLWIYGHLGSVAVPGGRIEAGQVIGNIGSAGHLHLEVQRGPSYKRSQSSNLDVVRNATLNPIKSFWELTNRNSGGASVPPTQPSGRRPYIIKSGDTLSGIAQRELGNGNRWREITKAGDGTFTDAEARRLQVGQTVYLPITYTSGSGTPVGTPPSSTPGVNSNINWVNFRGTVGPSNGVNLRNSTRFSDRSSSNEPYNKRLEFDGWTYGETVTDLWLGTPDARWFKVKGKNLWVPSAYIYGNPLNSSPMPGSGAVGNVDIIAEPIELPKPTLPDAFRVIDFMAQEFSNNPKTPEVRVMKFINDNIDRIALILNVIPGLEISTSSLAKTLAYAIWAGKVRSGGDWDHKTKVKARSDEKEWTIDGITGRYYQFESWSNSHYGYVGRIAGFSEFELLQGAGLVQTLTNGLGSLAMRIVEVVNAFIINPFNPRRIFDLVDVAERVYNVVYGSNPNANLFDPSSIDDPKDQSAIKDGFRLYNKYRFDVSKGQFMSDLRSNDSQLHNAYGLPQ
jgi:murein DD-endopeptidase MepM/ murein hydrolase activator NlpD